MIHFIAKLLRPLIEESLRQIHGERADQADACGMSALDRFGFMVLGGEPLRTPSSSQAPQSSSEVV